MKKILLVCFTLFSVAVYAQFTPNNLAVSRISSPSPITNSGMGFQTNIIEFTTAGVATTTNINLTGSGTDFVTEERPVAHETQLNLSADKSFLLLCGYNSTVGMPTSTLRASDKIIARVDGSGNIDMSTKILPAASLNSQSVRSVVSEDGLTYFINSGSNSTFHGTRKIDHGTEESTFFNNTGNSAHRSLFYYNGRILATTQGSSNVYSIDASGVGTQIPFAVQMGYHDYDQIQVFDVDPTVSWDGTGLDLMYIADRNAGLRKFYFNGTEWTPVSEGGLHNPNFLPTTGFWALTGRLEDGKPTLYGVKILVSGGAYVSSSLVKVVDNSQRTEDWNTLEGFLPTSTELATTGNTEMLKGVAFTPGSNTDILPIAINSFNGSLIKNVATLKWTTLTEINAKEFQVEHSLNGTNFRTIGYVPAKNNLNGASYSFDHPAITSGNNYYKLKLIDKDGSSKFSNIILVNKGIYPAIGINIFPNPSADIIHVTYPMVQQKTNLLILDMTGRVLLQRELGINTDRSVITVSNLVKGQYQVIITNAEGRMVSRFIK